MDTVYRTSLVFSRVEVLESLPAGELRTGEHLYETVLAPAQEAGGPKARYRRFDGADALLSILTEIAAETRVRASAPIIHLEAHGSEDGIQLASGEIVPWSAFARDLTPINQASKMNLLVVAGTCKGWDLTTGLVPADRAPLFMLVGAPNEIAAGTLDAAHRQFYSTLVGGGDINAALEAMNEGQDYSLWSIKPATAEILFCRVFRYYLDSLEDGVELLERENRLVAQVVRAYNLDLVESAIVRTQAREHLRNHSWWYNRLRHSFLMLDLFPENTSRFGLTYEKCLPTAT